MTGVKTMHEAAATPAWALLAYLVAGVCFILALRGLSSPESSRRGNFTGMAGMAIAIATTLSVHKIASLPEIVGAMVIGGGIGLVTARRIQMTAMPQLVAAFHSLVGMAAVLVGASAYLNPEAFGIAVRFTPIASPTIISIFPVSRIEMGLGVAIGAITFSGSVIAFLKLNGNMSGKPIILPARHVINLGTLAAILGLIAYFTQDQAPWVFFTVMGLSFAIGFLLIIPIGGADMPVVISMLNSYSGWAAAAMGFTLHNTAMIITGALVGSSGAILSYIMCRAMNRSFISVISGGFGGEAVAGGAAAAIDRPYKRGSAEDAAFLMKQAEQVIIVPGYGMAVAQAQHAVREMADLLKKEGVKVKYAIHPVAGRMPGHMNVLLAEANVPYDEVFELEDINSEFAQTDVAYVIGANDVTNPAAKNDKSSPIYGMPVLDVEKARTCLFVKRSMGGVGYAGIDNELFYRDNTMMLLGDAKKMTEEIVKALG
jgi:H+-translocating NAD(P) transhydrogenase subunit beta